MSEQTAYDPDTTPSHDHVPGITHEPVAEYPINPSPVGELFTDADGQPRYVPANADGTPVGIVVTEE